MTRQTPSIVTKFDRYRAEYDSARGNRYQRKPDGLPYRGGSADWHWRNELAFYSEMEICRSLAVDDPVISAGTALAVNNIIQDGFVPNPCTGDKSVDDDLWEWFKAWAEDPELVDESGECNFHEMELLVAHALLCDGDHVATCNPSGRLSLWEAHEIQTESRLPNTVLGVTLRGNRQRDFYHIRADPIESWKTPGRSVPIPTFSNDGLRQVLHVYVPKRAKQTRGRSAYGPITTIARFRDDIEFALLVQRQVASCFAIFKKRTQSKKNPMENTGYGDTETQRTPSGIRILENIGPGMEYTGEEGEELEGFSPNIPGGGYEFQHKTQLQLIGINLGLPLCVLFMDGSETNYSGWRGAVDEARKGFRANQRAIARKFHTPVWNWRTWYAARSDPALGRAAARLGAKFYAHTWEVPAWPYINPMDDAAADALILQEGLNSPRRLFNGKGKDYETITIETIEDRAFAITNAMIAANAIRKRFPNEPPVHWRELVSVPIKDAGIPTTILNQLAAGKQPVSGLPTPQSGPAEYKDISRLQLKRNQKAIRDALNEFISGNATKTFTEVTLGTLGLSPETVQKLLSDAADGQIDSPELDEVQA